MTRRDWWKCAAGAAASAHAQNRSDILYTGANVLTMDPANPVTDAIAVRDGRIIALGEEAKKLSFARMAIPLKRTMLPGFYAAHDHFPSWGSVALFQVDLNSPPIGRIETMAQLIDALRTRAQQTPKGEWIVGRGYDDTLLREMRHPTRRDLDQVSTDHPVWIVHISGHLGVANSRALELAKIDRTTVPKSGVIRREANGEPNGVFEENGSLVSHLIPGHSKEQRIQAIARAHQEYVSKGVTTAVIAGASPQTIADFRAARSQGKMFMRAVCLLSSGIPARFEDAIKLGDDHIRVTGVKMFEDGSLQGYTGHLSTPYHKTPPGKPDYVGYSNRSQDALNAMVLNRHQAGYQIAIHANGDAAIGEVLTAYREAQRAFPRKDTRHRIEHCQTPRPLQLDAMAAMGITPSFFVGHVYYWGDRHRDLFLGPERAARISPLASAAKRGIRYTIHNDTPVTPVDPLLLVWCSVNRLTRAGKVLGPEERVPLTAALRAVTSDAAWQNGEEKERGTIEVGKAADFVVLEEDPRKVDPQKLRDVTVVETIVGGETVYER